MHHIISTVFVVLRCITCQFKIGSAYKVGSIFFVYKNMLSHIKIM